MNFVQTYLWMDWSTFRSFVWLALLSLFAWSVPQLAYGDQAVSEATVMPVSTSAAIAQPLATPPQTQIKVTAIYRPRAEMDKKALGAELTDFTTSQRARVKLALMRDAWEVAVTPQHILVWGTSPATTSPTSGSFDFHEANLKGPLGNKGRFVLGRQELSFDNERLLGSVDWVQQGRAFDGLRMTLNKTVIWDAFIAYLNELKDSDKVLGGAHVESQFDNGSIAGIALAEWKDKPDLIRATLGPRLTLALSGFVLDAEAYLQTGKTEPGNKQTLAGLAAMRAGYGSKDKGTYRLGVDYLSGDSDLTDNNVHTFDTLWATNHKFYGTMDYFLTIPTHTKGLGLIDILLDAASAKIGDVVLLAGLHYLLTSVDTPAGNRDLGYEVDAWANYAINNFVNLTGGYSLFIAGNALSDIGRANAVGDVGHWLWLQMLVTIGNAL